jgi:imidazole glycerol-phosphate synthase subunit HisF
MLRTRIIPALLIRHESLVKTRRFGKFTYVGDPANTLRIFNELEVDELVILDITATSDGRGPNFDLLRIIASECFMPLGYGGGVRTLDHARTLFETGFEKVVVNSGAVERPQLVTELAEHFGSQAVIVSIDVRKTRRGKWAVYTRSGGRRTTLDVVAWAEMVAADGAGEILLTSIDREGTWEGFDLDLIRAVSAAVDIPVVAHGGAGSLDHIAAAVHDAGASAVALGSMVVFQKPRMGVLVHFPDRRRLEQALLRPVDRS